MDLRKESEKRFAKDLFCLMNDAVFEKTMRNVRKHNRNNRKNKNYLVAEPNYHTTRFFTENVAIEMKKTEILISKLVYLGV